MKSPRAEGDPGRVAFVVGTTAGGTGAHVRMLAAGCAARGMAVSVFGPSPAAAAHGFASLPGVLFTPVEFGDRPRPADAVAALRLRRAPRPGMAGVAHAHGVRAGALTVLALAYPRGRRPAIVVTVHNAPPHGGAAITMIYRVLERITARGADLVLCVSGDLERRMRAAGARRVERAIVPAPMASAPITSAAVGPAGAGPAGAAEARRAAGRPVVLAAGRLAVQKG